MAGLPIFLVQSDAVSVCRPRLLRLTTTHLPMANIHREPEVPDLQPVGVDMIEAEHSEDGGL